MGSARSAGNVDIHLALSRCADLFLRFGGHRQAAGLTLASDRVPEFTERLSRAVAEQTGGRPIAPEILCDGEMTLAEVTEETVNWLKRLEPFGMGNPAPRFLCEGVKPLSLRAVGAEGRHLKCTFQQGQAVRDGIFFGGGEWAGREAGLMRLAMSPTVNVFRGKVSAECRLYALGLMPESLNFSPEKEQTAFLSQRFSMESAEETAESQLSALMGNGQGTLLVCRSLETALRLHKAWPDADFCLGRADDPRAFSAVLLYGDPGNVSAAFRSIVLCDGQAGDAEAWKQACPGAAVRALPQSSGMRTMLSELYVDKAGLRACYALLRSCTPVDLADWSQKAGLDAGRAAFSLRVLESIGLIDCSFTPFRVSLLPMRKRGPEESGLFTAARRAKEETYGDGV